MGISNLKPQSGGTNFDDYNHSMVRSTSFNNSSQTTVVSVTGEGILTSIAVAERDATSNSLVTTVTVDGVSLGTIAASEIVVGLALMIPFKQSLLVQGSSNSSSTSAVYVSYGLKK